MTGAYTLKVTALTLSPAAGIFSAGQTVTLSTPTEGAQIRYTTDGTTPSATVGTVLASGGTVSVDRTTTIKSIAYKPGWADTLVTTSVYTLKVTALVLTPPAGTYYAGQTVAIATPTEGAQIRYTTDGTTPSSTVGTLLASGETVSVDRTTTIKAVAFKPGWSDTTVVSAVYALKVSVLKLTPAPGTYYGAQTVAISTPTEVADPVHDGRDDALVDGGNGAGQRRDRERRSEHDDQGDRLQGGLERHAGDERGLLVEGDSADADAGAGDVHLPPRR